MIYETIFWRKGIDSNLDPSWRLTLIPILETDLQSRPLSFYVPFFNVELYLFVSSVRCLNRFFLVGWDLSLQKVLTFIVGVLTITFASTGYRARDVGSETGTFFQNTTKLVTRATLSLWFMFPHYLLFCFLSFFLILFNISFSFP